MADGAEQRTAKRRRLDGDDHRRLLVGEHVEVCYFEEGLIGSWHSAVVVKCGKSYRMVEHDNLLNEDQSGKIVEKIPVSAAIDGSSRATLKYCREQIRPLPPPYDIQENDIRYGMCVDAFINEAWWEGVIFDHDEGSEKRSVFFPDLGDQDIVVIDRLRVTQDWDGVFGDWTPRGEWLLLRCLGDLEQKEGLPVSIRQIWYDLRDKPSFPERVKAWYLGTHDVWQVLVSELVQELWSVIHVIPAPEVVVPMQSENFHTSDDVIDVPVAADFNGWVDNSDTITPMHFENLLPSLSDIDMSMNDIPCQGTDFNFGELVDNLDTNLPLEQQSTEVMVLHGSSPDGKETCIGSLSTACDSGKTLVGDLDPAVNSSRAINMDATNCLENKDELNSAPEYCIDWKPVELKSDYCPEVLSMYAYSLEDGKTKPKSSKQPCGYSTQMKEKLKMHLLALGWKIDFRNDGMLRFRYRSPEGKTMYSLPQVYKYLMKQHPKNVVKHKRKHEMDLVNAQSEPSVAGESSLIKRARYQNAHDQQVDIEGKIASDTYKHVAKVAGSNVFRKSTCPESQNSILCVEDAGSNVFRDSTCPESQDNNRCVGEQDSAPEEVAEELRNVQIVHPEYLPEAIKEYEDYIDSLRQSKASNVDVTLLRLNAKKHLLYMGWYIWLKQKKTKCEMCYGAPDGRSYGSLTQACKAYLTADKPKIACARPQEQMNTTVTSSNPSDFHIEDSRKKIEKHELCSSSNLLATGIQESTASKIACTRPQEQVNTTVTSSNPSDFNIEDSREKIEKHEFCSSSNLLATGIQESTASKIACARPQEQMNTTVTSSNPSDFHIEDSGKKIEKHELCSSSNLLATGIQEPKASKIPDIRFSKLQSDGPIGSRTRSLRSPSSSALVLKSRKRTQQVVSPLAKDSSKTILSCLIHRNVVLPRQTVYSMCKDGISKKKGRISGQGIKCSCCGQLFTLTKFEAHAGYKTKHPYANIFLDDGRSLLQCQIQIMDSSRYKDFSHRRVKGDYSHYPTDVICSICHYGGDLILCDHCPSAFHISCLGLEEVPEGKWFCLSCKCGLCGDSEYNHDVTQFTTQTMLYCDQCEQEYHVGCLREKRSQELSHCPTGNWFCGKTCSKIYYHLHALLGKFNPASVDGLSWKILRWREGGRDDLDNICPEAMAAVHTKLSIAFDVLHECFVTIIEPRTQTDLSADIVFNKDSELKRLNFRGFYTMLLERGDEVISVATVRVFDGKVAEMPLIGTSLKFRRQGMCRLLVDEVEKLLYALGVEKLLLPAAPQLVETWTTSFGFNKLENSDRMELLKYPILSFQGTTLCQKFLRVPGSVSRK